MAFKRKISVNIDSQDDLTPSNVDCFNNKKQRNVNVTSNEPVDDATLNLDNYVELDKIIVENDSDQCPKHCVVNQPDHVIIFSEQFELHRFHSKAFSNCNYKLYIEISQELNSIPRMALAWKENKSSLIYWLNKNDHSTSIIWNIFEQFPNIVRSNIETDHAVAMENFHVWAVIRQKNSSHYLEIRICVQSPVSGCLILVDNYATFMNYLPDKRIEFMIPVMQILCQSFSPKHNAKNENNKCIDDFYALLREWKQTTGTKEYDSLSLPPLANLRPTLRSYQQTAVKWMLHREMSDKSKQFKATNVFIPHKVFDCTLLYYNTALGYFVTKEVYEQYLNELDLKASKGGILADEMGLGKTIETLSLILHHKKPRVNLKQNFVNDGFLFRDAADPLGGELQCTCGALSRTVRLTESFDAVKECILKQQYYLHGELIKCLLCANYQHIKCSKYDVGKHCFPYLCSRCWPKIDPIDSGCTLIVCPNSISKQWFDEIENHVEGVKVYRYQGVKQGYIFPPTLADNDIVLTTYDVLRYEVDFTSIRELPRFRGSKRYHSPVSPLLAVSWWRMCLDEAQNVEGTFARAAQMASYIRSKYRWAITGTPIQQDVNDLFGLMYYIEERPFDDKQIWNKTLYQSYCEGNTLPLVKAMSSCFWRTTMSEMMCELGVFPPKYHTRCLEFSQIERDFYVCEANVCRTAVGNCLVKIDPEDKFTQLSRTTQNKILQCALKLRQTCCHPQLCCVRKDPKKTSTTLSDVLEQMIIDAKYLCENHHRDKIANMNALASVYVIKRDLKSAIDTYKAALDSVNRYSEDFRTDKTQLFHIYYNLSELFELLDCQQVTSDGQPYPAFNGYSELKLSEEVKAKILQDFNSIDLSSTGENGKWRIKAKQVYDDYVTSRKLSCLTMDKYRLELSNNCDTLAKEFRLKNCWFLPVVETITKQWDIGSVASEIRFQHLNTVKSLQFNLQKKYDSLLTTRSEMVSSFGVILNELLEKNLVEQYIKCHVWRRTTRSAKCALCQAQICFKNYEQMLFNIVKLNERNIKRMDKSEPNSEQNDDADAENRFEGNWNDSNLLFALRRLSKMYKNFIKLYPTEAHIDSDVIIADMTLCCKYLDELKKEFKTYSKYWTALSDFVNSIDELNQAQTRFCVIDNNINCVITRFQNERQHCDEKVQGALTKLRYLSNLRDSLVGKDAVQSRMCSICWNDLTKYLVFPCGHFYCISCVRKMKMQLSAQFGNNSSLLCGVCRSVSRETDITEVNYETLRISKESHVTGSWSTKVVHIIRCVKTILERNEKILIFSPWISMLKVMQNSLCTNKIDSYLINSSDPHFTSKLADFRQNENMNVLLLPTNFACNGLNITEANNVIFINSTLNKADELQAIGRVYRIGQMRQTHVYKFIVKQTIEETIEQHYENVYWRRKTIKTEFSNMTMAQFMGLFQ